MDFNEADAECYDTPATHACLWLPAPGVLVTRGSGIGDLGAIKVYTRTMDRLIEQGLRYDVFHHWLGVTSFRPDAREHLRAWALAHLDQLNDAQYLVSTKLVAMAVSVAALALGRRLGVTTSEREFMKKLDSAIVASRRSRVIGGVKPGDG